MALILALIFLALFVSAIVRGNFSYQNHTYDFHEHPVQFVIVLAFVLIFSIFCFYRFLVEIGVKF